MSRWKEQQVVRDTRGRFANKPGGSGAGVGSGSGGSSGGGGLMGRAAREKAQTDMLSKIADVRKPHPMTWGDPKTKAGLHGKFEDTAESFRNKSGKTPACDHAIVASRAVLGFKSSQAAPTQPNFSVDSGVGDPKVAKERLSALATGYKGLADSDHPASSMAQEAADTVQTLATGMGLGNLDDSPGPKMNDAIRKKTGRA